MERTFHGQDISWTGHSKNKAFHWQDISWTGHFMDRTFHGQDIQRTGNFKKSTFHCVNMNIVQCRLYMTLIWNYILLNFQWHFFWYRNFSFGKGKKVTKNNFAKSLYAKYMLNLSLCYPGLGPEWSYYEPVPTYIIITYLSLYYYVLNA